MQRTGLSKRNAEGDPGEDLADVFVDVDTSGVAEGEDLERRKSVSGSMTESDCDEARKAGAIIGHGRFGITLLIRRKSDGEQEHTEPASDLVDTSASDSSGARYQSQTYLATPFTFTLACSLLGSKYRKSPPPTTWASTLGSKPSTDLICPVMVGTYTDLEPLYMSPIGHISSALTFRRQ